MKAYRPAAHLSVSLPCFLYLPSLGQLDQIEVLALALSAVIVVIGRHGRLCYLPRMMDVEQSAVFAVM